METISYLNALVNEEVKRRFKENYGFVPENLNELEYRYLGDNVFECEGYDFDNYPKNTITKMVLGDHMTWTILETRKRSNNRCKK